MNNVLWSWFISFQLVKDELQALQLAYSALEEKNRKTIEENQELVSIQDLKDSQTNLF